MRFEVLSGVERRRQWSDDEKARITEETLVPGARVAEVARRHGVSASLVFGWRRLARDGLLGRAVPALVPVEIVAPIPALPAPTPPRVPRPRRSVGLIGIELSQGRRLRVGSDLDGEALRRALDAPDRRRSRCRAAPRCGWRRVTPTASRRRGASPPGAVRAMARSDHRRCVSTPRWVRTSSKVVSMRRRRDEPGDDLLGRAVDVGAQQGLGGSVRLQRIADRRGKAGGQVWHGDVPRWKRRQPRPPAHFVNPPRSDRPSGQSRAEARPAYSGLHSVVASSEEFAIGLVRGVLQMPHES